MDNESDASRWQKPVNPEGGPSRMDILRQRHVLRRSVRDYLDG